MRPIDIAVAGCGPCGLASALLLARDGHRVTIFERFDAAQPVGSGLMLQPTGLAVLDRLGLGDAARAKGAVIERLIGRAGADGPVVLDVRYAAMRRPVSGIGIHRASLFGLLHDAVIDARIVIETGRQVVGSALVADGKRRLDFADGTSVGPFDLVVDTLGARSVLAAPTGRDLPYGALWASLDWVDGAGFDGAALEQRYRAARQMTGVMPIGTAPNHTMPQAAFFWSLRADALDAWRNRGLAAWADEVRTLWPICDVLLDQIGDSDQLTFARYAHRTLSRPASTGLIHMGDAWHSTSPQLGQGANMALLDAWALAQGLRSSGSVGEALAWTVHLRSDHINLYQNLSYWLTPVYQSDGNVVPFLRDRLVAPLSKIPPIPHVLAMLVSGLVGAPLGRLDLA
ncbi:MULTISPECIES: NAD(P)/FAD-dependent oxidoreductase [unclassified Sphingomonas]|uniref:FAD-dependent oxidoreductase n=1 Tax=unclassified Sphingomonas TaxID=196159 RepID=UPI000BC3C38E|nr:MAG: glutamate synthase [Sphingomonas sp. 12-62-6]OYX38310.1 MAG: glutamate synthase [Sphingomonas sp. 32-62-10]